MAGTAWFGDLSGFRERLIEKPQPRGQALSSRAQHIERPLLSQGAPLLRKYLDLYGKTICCDDLRG
ncbi:hypothetical protein [Methylocystis echinoides]|jgi:hypothetical protein|uniref:hypothetical protein n=1 Tax=Methylocystis echinoides TaxID=29468 RepID=UPI0034474973